jgi:hypothetical protein
MPIDWKPWLVGLLLPGFACQTNDLGKPCGSALTDLGTEPIAGEQPVIEVVRIERDQACETFQCLTHRGLHPYCTRVCDQDGDCPTGFACEAVQEVGPLADKKYCVYKLGCQRNIDCKDLGNILCVKFACLDACLVTGDSNDCQFHQLKCYDRADLGCQCPQSAEANAVCSDEEVICQPAGAGEALPAGAVHQLNACVPKQESTP